MRVASAQGLFDALLQRARQNPKKIVLTEGSDPRVIAAAVSAKQDGIAHPVLLGSPREITPQLKQFGQSVDDFDIVDIANELFKKRLLARYNSLRPNLPEKKRPTLITLAKPENISALMVATHLADGSIGGAQATTADTVRAALRYIGPARASAMVSSFTLMLLEETHHPKQGILLFADCGLVIEPTTAELAQIAIASADSLAHLLSEPPAVALLSFSTNGSASHDRVEQVEQAVALIRGRRPDLKVDGGIQFDAAFVPAVCAQKSPLSPLAGQANVLVFPNLEAANIGYKIAERIGKAIAIGPILQGLAKPANDLSRGCSADDIYRLLAITSIQAAGQSVSNASGDKQKAVDLIS